MEKLICIGFFKDFDGEDSVLISVDADGLLELENVFLELANGLAKFNFSELKQLNNKFRIDMIAYNNEQNIGLRINQSGKYEWRNSKEKWNQFREQLTTMYRNANGGHHYLDSEALDNGDLQVVFSWDEYSLSFWQQSDK